MSSTRLDDLRHQGTPHAAGVECLRLGARPLSRGGSETGRIQHWRSQCDATTLRRLMLLSSFSW